MSEPISRPLAELNPRENAEQTQILARKIQPTPAARRRWKRALAAVDRAAAGLDRFRAEEGAIPHEERTFAFENDLDERFSRLECARLGAIARLLRLPSPDLPALAVKIALIVDEAAWEFTDAEPCLAALKSDAQRLCNGG
jgi:hypothetical protein